MCVLFFFSLSVTDSILMLIITDRVLSDRQYYLLSSLILNIYKRTSFFMQNLQNNKNHEHKSKEYMPFMYIIKFYYYFCYCWINPVIKEWRFRLNLVYILSKLHLLNNTCRILNKRLIEYLIVSFSIKKRFEIYLTFKLWNFSQFHRM